MLAFFVFFSGAREAFGLNASDMSRMNDREVDEYLGDALDMPRDDPFENLAMFIEDEVIDVVGAPVNDTGLLNKNREFEAALIAQRALVTPLPEPVFVERRAAVVAKPAKESSVLKKHYVGEGSVKQHRYDGDYEDWYGGDLIDCNDGEFEEAMKDTMKRVRPNFVLSEIVPRSMHHYGGKDVVIKVDPVQEGFCMCRFDQIVVNGNVNGSGWARCRVPGHEPGHVPVFYSRNGKQWFGPIEFVYELPDGLETILVILPTVAVSAALFGLVIWGVIRLAKSVHV